MESEFDQIKFTSTAELIEDFHIYKLPIVSLILAIVISVQTEISKITTDSRRRKVDGSLTWSPGSKLNCELSGTGRLADLYSDFGVQRILECLRSSKSEVGFSATGRGLRIAKYAAKFDKIGVFVVTSLTIKTSWRRGGDSNPRYSF